MLVLWGHTDDAGDAGDARDAGDAVMPIVRSDEA